MKLLKTTIKLSVPVLFVLSLLFIGVASDIGLAAQDPDTAVPSRSDPDTAVPSRSDPDTAVPSRSEPDTAIPTKIIGDSL